MAKLSKGFKSRKQLKRLKKNSINLKKFWQYRGESNETDDTQGQPQQQHDHNYAQDPYSAPTWRQGRRIVELGVLADALSGCSSCRQPLYLSSTQEILTYGLGAILKIPCSNGDCGFTNSVPTGKRHGKIWDANTKLAFASVHAGIGSRQVNNLLTSLNIPPVSEPTLYARQKEIGPAIESIADESVRDSIKEEIRLTKENSKEDKLTVCVDGAWQKRGSGRSYDSLSGHCSMVGAETGKIVGYSVRSKFCKTYDNAKQKGQTPKPHDCRMNWQGSSKAMESDMVIEMVTKKQQEGIEIETIVGDDDATTITRLQKAVKTQIKKRSDSNHVRKNISASLYALRGKYQILTVRVIKYLMKCVNYLLAQNRDNPEGIRRGFEGLCGHVFGDHKACDTSWCSHKENPDKKFQSLPYGRPLKDSNLQKALIDIFSKYRDQSERLSRLSSTQINESFNKTVASKAPKTHFFSGSASLNQRVAAGVAQKNIGYKYVSKANRKIDLSPGEYTLKLATLRDLQTRKKRALCITRKAKRRRLELKSRRYQTNVTKELREGTSYSANVDALAVPDEELEEIPPPKPQPSLTTIVIPATCKPVYFDLETTGLARTSHIVQIATACGDDKFDTYVTPKMPISSAAASVTGLTLRNGRLYSKGQPVEAVSIGAALDNLIQFIKKQSPPVVLAGHNIKTFDCYVLMNALDLTGKLEAFFENVSGFFDTKLLFKSAIPGLSSYSQPDLVVYIMGTQYSAHDAVEDVVALQQLVIGSNVDISDKKFGMSTFSIEYLQQSHVHCKRVRKNLPSLLPLIKSKALSEAMARKAAGSDLNCRCLHLAYMRDGVDGIRDVLGEQCGKGPRVTKSVKIIQTVADYFKELLANSNEM